MNSIRQKLINQKIWVSIDETTDAVDRYVANVVIGILPESEEIESSFLFHDEFLEKTNSTTITRLFDDSIKLSLRLKICLIVTTFCI